MMPENTEMSIEQRILTSLGGQQNNPDHEEGDEYPSKNALVEEGATDDEDSQDDQSAAASEERRKKKARITYSNWNQRP